MKWNFTNLDWTVSDCRLAFNGKAHGVGTLINCVLTIPTSNTSPEYWKYESGGCPNFSVTNWPLVNEK